MIEGLTPEQEAAYKQQLEEWKDEHYGSVFVIEIGDIEYIFRGLTRAEYNKANDYYEDEFDRNEYVCRKCVLYPEIEDYSLDMYAGVPEVLAQAILEQSGFTMSKDQFNQKLFIKEKEMETMASQMPCVIKEAFQDIPFEEIDSWQFEKQLDYFAKAKWILATLRGVVLETDEDDPAMKAAREGQMMQG